MGERLSGYRRSGNAGVDRGVASYVDLRLERLVRQVPSRFTEGYRRRVGDHIDRLGSEVPPGDLREVLVHADLAPANVLISDARVVVLDFAMSNRGSMFHDLSRLFVSSTCWYETAVPPGAESHYTCVIKGSIRTRSGGHVPLSAGAPLILRHRSSVGGISASVYNWNVAASTVGGSVGAAIDRRGAEMNAILGLGARLSKLRAMSPGEVVERLRYRAVLAGERAQHRRQRLAPPGRLRESLNASLQKSGWQGRLIASRQANRTRFLPGVHDRDAMRRLFDSTYDQERRDTLAHAASARRHHFEFFGRAFDYGDTIPWQADPVSGCAWPSGFHADVPIHQGDIGCGDVKHVWELSRQQYLIDLGKRIFGGTPKRTAIRRLVRGIAGNPTNWVNWACALEPHTDFSGLGLYMRCRLARFSTDGWRVATTRAVLASLWSAIRVRTIPDRRSGGDLYDGCCFHELRASVKWLRSEAGLKNTFEQFYRDGGPVEQSTFYHHATTGFYLLAALTGRATGDDLSGDVWRAIERGLDFSLALMQPDGSTPEIGGADDGKPIRMEHRRFWDFRPYQALGAVLLRRADFKAAAGRFFEDALWLLGPAGAVGFDAIEETTPSARAFALDATAIVARSDWSPRADSLLRLRRTAGARNRCRSELEHGHADCISLILWLDGRRVLVDPVIRLQLGGYGKRIFAKPQPQHRTRGGCDQAHIGKWWSHSYRATPNLDGHGAQTWVIGSHDGRPRATRHQASAGRLVAAGELHAGLR